MTKGRGRDTLFRKTQQSAAADALQSRHRIWSTPMDRIAAMQTFVRVVEAGTFTKAADNLGLPKPTVTRLVQSLESQLDTLLLNRTTRRVTVTQDGAAYYDRAVRLLSDRSLSLEQVAEHLGFGDARSLHRAFRKWTGAAPGAYRGG